ncbi:MAG: ATP-binding protein [candidate division Zixibacteria bacterium]|jgi:two-component system sensor histidine kinase PilS (NtrC family)|nr:ATP-binding protein [candidate division Zixibacteria bacterium]
MKERTDPSTARLAWFVPLRLALYVILFLIVVLWMGYPGYLRVPFVVYSALTLLLTLSLFFEPRVRLRAASGMVVTLQFLSEISIEAAIILATGNVNSHFSVLFVLTIVSAALVYRLVGTFLIASVVSVSYCYIIWVGLYDSGAAGATTRVLETIFVVRDSVFYAIFLHILIFYLVAFMSGYLADRFRAEKQALADTSSELRRARLETDDILRNLNSGLLTIDAQGYVIYFNQAAEKILGYHEEDVKGILCDEVFAERMPELADSLRDALRSLKDQPRKEITITGTTGQSVPLGLSTSVLIEENGSPRGVIAIFTDLTEAKVLEAKVRAADRLAAVGELSASIAHEIRNPLAAISGSVEVLQHELQLKGPNDQLMQLIVKESHRLSKILTDFLSYARIGRPSYHKVDLYRVIYEVIELVRHHDSYRPEMDIAVQGDEPVVYVVGDADVFKQLLLNLAINAIDAFDGGEGRLVFRFVPAPSDGIISLSIEDDGPGMPPAVRERIFEPFYSTKKQGTGLGLSIVHRICSMQKLDFNVESRPGAGTVFTINFRRFATPASPPVHTPDHLSAMVRS